MKKLISLILITAFVSTGLVSIGCEKKVKEEKTEQRDDNGNVTHRYEKDVTRDGDTGKETTTVKETKTK